MTLNEKIYPDWVQQHRTRGTTVKKKGDAYYLYKRTSKRVPGKKWPQPVDTFIGVITPEGVIASNKRKVSLTDIEVYEFGFSKALLDLCPNGWKKPLGDDWENVLLVILKTWSPQSYLLRGKEGLKEDDYHYSFPAQMASLSRRMYKEHGVDPRDLEVLKTVYLLIIDKKEVISKINDVQRELAERTGLRLVVE